MFHDLVSGVTVRNARSWSDNLISSVASCFLKRGMSGGPITEWTTKKRYVADKMSVRTPYRVYIADDMLAPIGEKRLSTQTCEDGWVHKMIKIKLQRYKST